MITIERQLGLLQRELMPRVGVPSSPPTYPAFQKSGRLAVRHEPQHEQVLKIFLVIPLTLS